MSGERESSRGGKRDPGPMCVLGMRLLDFWAAATCRSWLAGGRVEKYGDGSFRVADEIQVRTSSATDNTCVFNLPCKIAINLTIKKYVMKRFILHKLPHYPAATIPAAAKPSSPSRQRLLFPCSVHAGTTRDRSQRQHHGVTRPHILLTKATYALALATAMTSPDTTVLTSYQSPSRAS